MPDFAATGGNFLIIVAVVLAAIMVAFRVYHDIVVAENWGLNDALSILQFVLVLLVASIPVAMPAVFSITMALGALALSKQKAIVSRSALTAGTAGASAAGTNGVTVAGPSAQTRIIAGSPLVLSKCTP